jgi:sec-independent protein translocase protein TatA
MFGLGYQELLLILVIVLILFGAQRLPDLARSLGQEGRGRGEGRARGGREEGRREEGVVPLP